MQLAPSTCLDNGTEWGPTINDPSHVPTGPWCGSYHGWTKLLDPKMFLTPAEYVSMKARESFADEWEYEILGVGSPNKRKCLSGCYESYPL
jgi:hypothetical protein